MLGCSPNRELDDVLGLTAMASNIPADARTPRGHYIRGACSDPGVGMAVVKIFVVGADDRATAARVWLRSRGHTVYEPAPPGLTVRDRSFSDTEWICASAEAVATFDGLDTPEARSALALGRALDLCVLVLPAGGLSKWRVLGR
jgi:hypothetical protein